MRPLLGGGLAGNWGRHSLLWLTSGNWMAAHGGPCRAALRLGWPLHGAASRLPIQRLRHRLLLLPHSCGVALSGHQIVKVVQDVVAPAGRGVRFGENGVQTAPVLASLHTAGMLVQTAQHAGGNLAPRSNHGSAAGQKAKAVRQCGRAHRCSSWRCSARDRCCPSCTQRRRMPDQQGARSQGEQRVEGRRAATFLQCNCHCLQAQSQQQGAESSSQIQRLR